MTGRYFFSVILLICVATAAAQNGCPHIFVTKTGIQADGATRGSQVGLSFNYTGGEPHNIANISRFNILGEHYESFQNDTVDVFAFEGRCELYCNVSIEFRGLPTGESSWNVSLFMLRGALTDYGCDYNKTYKGVPLSGRYDEFPFNFCTGKLGNGKHERTGASLLRLVGMPSYTT